MRMPPLTAELIARPDTLGRAFPHVNINGAQRAKDWVYSYVIEQSDAASPMR
jgi:hypothetical protein